MALRLRRGTDAERLLITPLQGELIYTIDTKLLYVGDGTTAGGTLVTGTGSGGATTLAALTDTDVTGIADGDVLTWNSVDSKWEPMPIAVGGDGVIDGSNYNINIVSDDSVVIVDGSTSSFYGDFFGGFYGNLTGNVDGNVTGELIGSVFGDDSSILVDGINNTITAASLNTNLIQADYDKIVIESGAAGTALSISGITSGEFGGESSLSLDSSKGTLDNPQDTIAGDIIGALKVRGLNNGSQVLGSIQQTFWDAGANFSETYPKSGLRLMANAGDGKGTLLRQNGDPTGFNHMTLRGDGALEGPIFKMIVVADTTARDALITAPEAGMIVFVTDVAKFQGNTDGTITGWANLN